MEDLHDKDIAAPVSSEADSDAAQCSGAPQEDAGAAATGDVSRETIPAGALENGPADVDLPAEDDVDATEVSDADVVDAAEAATEEVETPTDEVRELFGMSFGAIRHFATMLEEEGELRGLIGPRELPRLWSRHLVNSAALLDFIPSRAQLLDVGSGAGFPGLVIAIARPDVDVHLVEPMTRRCEWLADVVEEIGLDNVTIHEAQAQQLRGQGQADIVTARAVANVRKLLPICMPLVQPGGKVLALKGRRVQQEVDDALSVFAQHAVADYRIHEVPSVMEDESTMVLELVKARDMRQRGRERKPNARGGAKTRAKTRAKSGGKSGTKRGGKSGVEPGGPKSGRNPYQGKNNKDGRSDGRTGASR